MSSYQVLFGGEIVEGANDEAVQANLAKVLGLELRKVRQLFSGRTVVIKSQLGQQEALELQILLQELGAVCRVKNLAPQTDADPARYRLDDKSTDYTLRDITAAHQECPRCSHMQLESSHCARCGIDLLAAAKQKRKEDMIIAKRIQELRGGKPSTIAGNGDTHSKVRFEASDLSEISPSDKRPDKRRAAQTTRRAAKKASPKKSSKVLSWFKKIG